MIKVGVIGAGGKMGSAVMAAVESAPDLELTALIDPIVDSLAPGRDLVRAESLSELNDGDADVLVDFSTPDAVNGHLLEGLERGFHMVVGTTGLRDDVLDNVRVAAGKGGNVVIAANFALGAVLLMGFAQHAAKYFDGVEIIELHHDKKLDAPSGTALATARHISQGRSEVDKGAPHDATSKISLDGARGARTEDGITIHSVRLPGLVAHEEVIFGNPGETLTLRHDSYDRSSFMPGVLLAIRSVETRPGLTVGLEHLISD